MLGGNPPRPNTVGGNNGGAVGSSQGGAGEGVVSSGANPAPDLIPDVPDGVPYFRVQGGGVGTATSREALTLNTDGSVSIGPGCTGAICVSAGTADHAIYYITKRRPDGNVLVFEVDRATHNEIMDVAVDQKDNAGMPVQKVDKSTSGSSTSLQLDQVYSELMSNNSYNGGVLSQQEFLDEFGPN